VESRWTEPWKVRKRHHRLLQKCKKVDATVESSRKSGQNRGKLVESWWTEPWKVQKMIKHWRSSVVSSRRAKRGGNLLRSRLGKNHSEHYVHSVRNSYCQLFTAHCLQSTMARRHVRRNNWRRKSYSRRRLPTTARRQRTRLGSCQLPTKHPNIPSARLGDLTSIAAAPLIDPESEKAL
jgi:hypothetical protein